MSTFVRSFWVLIKINSSMSRFRPKLPRMGNHCQMAMPTPVFPICAISRTPPKAILEINPPLFPTQMEPPTIDVVPLKVMSYPPDHSIPVGTILSCQLTSPPVNYLFCNGAEIPRATYIPLFNKIGTYYGDGNGSTTFNIPLLTNDRDPTMKYLINYVDIEIVPPTTQTGCCTGSTGSTGSQPDTIPPPTSLQILPYPMDFVPPPGTILHNTVNFVPPGYLLCDGSAVSRNDYVLLFNMVGVFYGNGDGSTTFNLPNLVTPSHPYQYIMRYEMQMIPCVTISPNLTLSGMNMSGETFNFT